MNLYEVYRFCLNRRICFELNSWVPTNLKHPMNLIMFIVVLVVGTPQIGHPYIQALSQDML
jgi:hypothetical protein